MPNSHKIVLSQKDVILGLTKRYGFEETRRVIFGDDGDVGLKARLQQAFNVSDLKLSRRPVRVRIHTEKEFLGHDTMTIFSVEIMLSDFDDEMRFRLAYL